MKSSTIALSLLASATLVVTSGGGGGNSARAASGDIVDGGTFTMTLSADPGNLDPQSSPASTLFQVSEFAYDSLLSMDPEDGAIQSGAGHRLVGRRHRGDAHPRRRHHVL